MKRKSEDIFDKYNEDCDSLFWGRDPQNPDYTVEFYRRRKDGNYFIVTSRGEEFPISLETIDKVRDICCGNLRSLNDYESEVFEKVSQPSLLKSIAKESMRRFFEREYGSDPTFGLWVLDLIFDPHTYLESGFYDEEEEKRLKDNLGKFLKTMGLDIDPGFGKLTQLATKIASDMSFERKEFIRRVHIKKKINK